ncbi:MAG: D-alanyl-D-alanine carboxypeptidase family protein [Oscillospiraceae bacterium]
MKTKTTNQIRAFFGVGFLFLTLGSFVPNRVAASGEPTISAVSAALIEADSGRIIFEKSGEETLPIASTTKMMSALLTLESSELDRYFTVDPSAILVEGTSMGLLKGDQVTLRILAAGMLLASGNDAANAAAVKVAGSQDEFAIMMNRRAAQIGMKNTNFVTPSGLDAQSHYSTAMDMAKLGRAALQNADFKKICAQKSAKLSYGNPPYDRWLSNHNKLLKIYPDAIGIKTGFTKKAGRCLVSAAEREGVTLICVTLKASSDWEDHRKLLDYGFERVQAIELPTELGTVTIPLVGGMKNFVTPVVQTPLKATITEDDLAKISWKIISEPFLYAPVSAGDSIGEIRYYLNGERIKTAPITAKESVEVSAKPPKISFLEKIKRWFFEWK